MDRRAVDLEEFLALRGLVPSAIVVKIHTKTNATIVVKPGIGLLEPKQRKEDETTCSGNIL